MSGFHKMLHYHTVQIYHYKDNQGDQWLLDGISKHRGAAAGLPFAGWTWTTAHTGGGLWETRDPQQAKAMIDRGIPWMEGYTE